MAKLFEPELGQAMFGPDHLGYEPPQFYLREMERLGNAVAKNNSPYFYNPCENTGTIFENDVFIMQSHYWGDHDGETEQQDGLQDEFEATEEDGEIPEWDGSGCSRRCRACKPNFLFRDSGFAMRWYKHSRRSPSTNDASISEEDFRKMIDECIESI